MTARRQYDIEMSMHIGKKLRDIRTARAWTQQHCATILQCSKGQYAKYERGETVITAPGLLAMAHAFGVSPMDLFRD